MKKIFSIFICLIFVGMHLSKGQVILNPRYFGGYIVTFNNDTLRGTIKLPKSASKGDFSYTDILWKVRFVDKNGVETKYFPSQLKSFTFWLDQGKEINFVSRQNTVKAFGGFGSEHDNFFLELAIGGHLKLLRGYFFTLTPNGQEVNTINYLQKGNEGLFRYHQVIFRMDLATYLKENDELARKIVKREYHARDIEKVVIEYNTWYDKLQENNRSKTATQALTPKEKRGVRKEFRKNNRKR